MDQEKDAAVSLPIGAMAPDFTAETTEGTIRFHDWLGDAWCVMVSHPKDFTPVCTTELGALARLKPEFDRRGVRLIGLSVDPVSRHQAWAADIAAVAGAAPGFPMIGDTDLTVARLYAMLPQDAAGDATTRTAADNATVRAVYVIGPDKRIRLTLAYPMSTGRNMAELLRVVDALQLTERHRVATPVDWHQGEEVIILPAIADDDALSAFPAGWRAPLPYMRIVPQPGGSAR
jgi:alkyl hydroperoxide reductase subunit AhpC